MLALADRLTHHLASWVGEWPPPTDGVTIVGDTSRTQPTWDDSIRPLIGVGTGGNGTVIAVPPEHVEAVTAAVADGLDRSGLGNELGSILGVGEARFGAGVFRSTTTVDSSIIDIGDWYEQQDGTLPDWLAPFNGPRLVVRDDSGDVIASVGIKVHDAVGQELAVVTEPAAEGKGLARRLVATAARRVLDEGGIPTYLHAPDNIASAHVAAAVGFADHGWTVHGLWPRD